MKQNDSAIPFVLGYFITVRRLGFVGFKLSTWKKVLLNKNLPFFKQSTLLTYNTIESNIGKKVAPWSNTNYQSKKAYMYRTEVKFWHSEKQTNFEKIFHTNLTWLSSVKFYTPNRPTLKIKIPQSGTQIFQKSFMTEVLVQSARSEQMGKL